VTYHNEFNLIVLVWLWNKKCYVYHPQICFWNQPLLSE